jgi:two-component system, NarL family, sensor histidine kinase UhpB
MSPGPVEPSLNGAGPADRRARARRYLPLLYRVAGFNAVALVVAVVITILVLDPHRVSAFRLDAEGVLVAAVVLVAVAGNLYVLRRVVGPVQALTALARRVDLTGRGERMPVPRRASEASELAATFNDMLERLEAERREATGRVLAGQEAERLRIAQELHDQVGQELTAVLLGLSRVQARVPSELVRDVSDVQEAVRDSLEQVRNIAVELRPEALDDLGLESALAVLGQRFGELAGVRVSHRVVDGLPALAPEVELVVYRVAQEALTNVARHADADAAELAIDVDDGCLVLTVSDGGRGMAPDRRAGSGIRGMRERATLIGAELSIGPRDGTGGCRVRLAVPLEAR